MRRTLLRALSRAFVVSDRDELLKLLYQLGARNYEFVVVTPSTHARALSRQRRRPPTLRDIFGWNRPFTPAELEPALLATLERAAAVEQLDGKLRSKVRVASLGESLYIHSSYPTEQQDSVFFGPDTYRFVRFVRQRLTAMSAPKWAVDMGAGAGAGGIAVAQAAPGARVTLVDINPTALRFAAMNARYAAVCVETLESGSIPAGADLIIANPPYMMDASHRTYRDGGNLLGGSVALDWVQLGLGSLAANGTMLLYTGVAYVDGRSPLIEAIQEACSEAGAALSVEELDPDVFGEELESANYAEVERIAAIGAVITLARE
jgi:methylase of polypeptide subunit release factors